MYLVLLITTAVAFAVHRYFWKKRKKPHHGESVTITAKKKSLIVSKPTLAKELPRSVIAEIWDLFQKFFINEFPGLDGFEQFLHDGRTVILFRDTVDKSLKGFQIIRLAKLQLPGETKEIHVIVGDFFALSREYRMLSSPIIALLKFCVKHKLSHPLTEMYYFFVTYSYRSYVSFGHSMGDYWPRHSKPTPRREKQVLDAMALEAASDWGEYNEETGVITDKYRGTKGRLSLVVSGPQVLTRTVTFFLQRNPGYLHGDCFCVIAKIGAKNAAICAFNSFKRLLGFGRTRRHVISPVAADSTAAAANTPAAGRESVPSKKGKWPLEPHVAFGMARRLDDAVPSRADIRPFLVRVPDDVLVDLRQRLDRVRLPEPFADAPAWDHGVDTTYLCDLIRYWRQQYDWRTHEERLNQLHQYTVAIDDMDVHFVHVTSARLPAGGPAVVLLHGWPGSVYEFYKLVDRIVTPSKYGHAAETLAMHVVAPSLPGYGWSEAPTERGFDVVAIARLLVKLMQCLGYRKYIAQGGDWGHLVAAHMALLDPEHCVGVHLNMVIPRGVAGDDEPTPPGIAGMVGMWIKKLRMATDWTLRRWLLDRRDVAMVKRMAALAETELGYIAVHATKPQTLGVALNDSPAGLAAWIVDKFRAWSDCHGNVEERFTKDELLTNVMIYWVTQTITSSMRLYLESKRAGTFCAPLSRVDTPTAVAVFPGDIVGGPRKWCTDTYNIVRWTYMPRGGHFAALEEPDLLANDIRAFAMQLGLDKVATTSTAAAPSSPLASGNSQEASTPSGNPLSRTGDGRRVAMSTNATAFTPAPEIEDENTPLLDTQDASEQAQKQSTDDSNNGAKDTAEKPPAKAAEGQ